MLKTAQEPPNRRPKNRPRAAQKVSRRWPRGAWDTEAAQEPPEPLLALEFGPFWQRLLTIVGGLLNDGLITKPEADKALADAKIVEEYYKYRKFT